jgi:hypothetical protein
MLSAEWGWLDRCGGATRGPALKPDDYPTIKTVIDQWTIVEDHFREFLSNLTDDALARIVEYTLGEKRSGMMGPRCNTA